MVSTTGVVQDQVRSGDGRDVGSSEAADDRERQDPR
jgi:hypothetical protein